MKVTPTGVSAKRVYTSRDETIHVHLQRVTKCPPGFPAGNYWYGNRRNGPGRPPKWVDRLPLTEEVTNEPDTAIDESDTTSDSPMDVPLPVEEESSPSPVPLDEEKSAQNPTSKATEPVVSRDEVRPRDRQQEASRKPKPGKKQQGPSSLARTQTRNVPPGYLRYARVELK